jgi:hypothetical protein
MGDSLEGGTLCRKGRRCAGWLLRERTTWGQPEDRKDSWSNPPAAATLEELAGSAHRRHAVTVMPAYSFLVWLERRQRRAACGRDRPRAPFSPFNRTGGDAPCRQSTERSPWGCATKPSSGG